MGDAVPAFLTIVLMPFTYSIANGLIGGVCSYILLNTTVWLVEKASGGRIVPHDKAEKDPWTWRIPGGILPPWARRLTQGKKDFWRDHEVPVTESASDVPGRQAEKSMDSNEGVKDSSKIINVPDAGRHGSS